MITALTGVVLTGWLAVTALVPLPVVGKAVRRALPEWLSPLVPSWTFFAPRPGTDDRVLFYRDLLANGEVGPLRAVWPQEPPPGRARKAVADAASQLSAFIPARPESSGAERNLEIMVSPPYLLLLARCAAARHDMAAVGVQFAVVLTNLREEPPRVVFTSAVHRLEPQAPTGAMA